MLHVAPALASQASFRAVMAAMARPGGIVPLAPHIGAPAPLAPSLAAIAIALVDFETPVWLDPPLAATGEVAAWLRFETGAPVVTDPGAAAFALIAAPAALAPFETFALGSDDYPDRGATLVLQVEQLQTSGAFTLSGPGVGAPRSFFAAPLPDDFAARMAANRALFPRGVDLILAGLDAVAALPRSVHLTTGGA